MDAAAASASLSAENPATPPRPRVPVFRWIWQPLALGALLALSRALMGEIGRVGSELLILNSPFYYAHQSQLSVGVALLEFLLVPIATLLVTLVVVLRGGAGAPRGTALLRLTGAIIGLIALEWGGPLGTIALYQALEQSATPETTYTIAQQVAMVEYAVQGVALGVALIGLLRLAAPRLVPRQGVLRAGYWLVAGAAAGLVTGMLTVLPGVLELSLSYMRLSYIGGNTCTGTSGDPRACFGGQLFDVSMPALGLIAGAALGGLASGLLLPNLRAAEAAQPSAERAESAPSSGLAQVDSGDIAAIRRLARIGRAVAPLVAGALYGLLVYALINRPAVTTYPIGSSPTGSGWALVAPALALGLPTGLVALVAARRRLARLLGAVGGRALPAALFVVFTALAVGVPAVLGVSATTAIAFGEYSALVLAAFALGVAIGLVASLRVPSQTGRAGLRAATVGWLGFSLVLAGLVAYAFYLLVIPGTAVAASTCHGLGCGALYAVATFSLVGGGIQTILVGLPAAALGGTLAALLAGALRQPSHSGSGATPSASTMRL